MVGVILMPLQIIPQYCTTIKFVLHCTSLELYPGSGFLVVRGGTVVFQIVHYIAHDNNYNFVRTSNIIKEY